MRVSLLKKVLFMSTFFVSAPLFSTPCPPLEETELAHVKWVYDGDTVKLSDGRKLRIIGIDTPEVSRKKKKGEAYAGQATEQLRELLAKNKNKIKILIGKQTHDKYKRLLAHIFTPDNINISQWMLKKGLATTLIIPPNDRYADCYQSAEQSAQNKRLNIWQQSSFQIKNSQTLNKRYTGYIRLRGTVQTIKRRKNKLTIELENKIYITIKKPDLKRFKYIKAAHLKGKPLLVTGILHKYGKRRYIRVRHPLYLNLE